MLLALPSYLLGNKSLPSVIEKRICSVVNHRENLGRTDNTAWDFSAVGGTEADLINLLRTVI